MLVYLVYLSVEIAKMKGYGLYARLCVYHRERLAMMSLQQHFLFHLWCYDKKYICCDELSKFRCTQQSNAQCQCTGLCDEVDRYRVNTINIPMTSTQGSHTFNVIDVEIYAVFSILWLLLFLVSMFVCWRLHITLDFFRV